jgi:hypothetical protein
MSGTVKGRVPPLPVLRVEHSSDERRWVSDEVGGAHVRDRVLGRAIQGERR